MASNNTQQRITVAGQAVAAATSLLDALRNLENLRDLRSFFLADFADTDFADPSLAHLSAGMLGTLFDFVVPSLRTAVNDAGNAGRNLQILNQTRRG